MRNACATEPIQTIYGFAEPVTAGAATATAAATAAAMTQSQQRSLVAAGELRRMLAIAAKRTAHWMRAKNEAAI